MCNCIKETTEKIIDHLRETKKGYTIKEPKGPFSGTGFTDLRLVVPSGGVRLVANFHYEESFTKTNGQESKVIRRKTKVYFTFCPFCGERYDKKEE